MQNSEFPFKIVEIGTERIALADRAEQTTVVELNHMIDAWSFMQTIEVDGEAIAVLESHSDSGGWIIYANAESIIAQFPKTLEPLRVPEETCYLGRTLQEVMEVDEDLLGNDILAREEDPTYDLVASCLPPLQKLGQLNVASFVGTRHCMDKPAILDNVFSSICNFGGVTPELRRAERGEVRPPRDIYQGLVGGWLPILYYEVEGWEFTIFADPEPPTQWIQPVWYRLAKIRAGGILETHYCDTYAPLPPRSQPDPRAFYTKLLELSREWHAVLEPAMQIAVPDDWISDMCKHSLVREMITRIDDWPKYGVYTKDYNGPEHDGFQDTFNASVNAMLGWGLFDVARKYIENYLTYFVKDDGALEYRGIETGEYGRQLATISEYYHFSKDHALLLKYHQKIRTMVDYLLGLRQAAKELPPDDPAYGMLKGWCEADSCGRPDPHMYNLVYYSNSTEAVRAFHDLGGAWHSIGKKLGRQDLLEQGQKLVQESADLKADLYTSIEKSILTSEALPHLPGLAGATEPYNKMKPEKFRSNSWVAGEINRTYNEMLHSGCLSRAMVETIIRYQSKFGGRWLGLPGRRGSMDGFTSYEYAYGLLQHDLIKEFLLFYYSHMAHIYTRGNWTATEYGNADRSKPSSNYCAPAQGTIPALTKWMLVFEDPFAPVLWLANGAPRHWLAQGNTIAVTGAPTRWGYISYTIAPAAASAQVEIDLPDEGFDAAIHLRLRASAAQKISAVRLNGELWIDFRPDDETVILPTGLQGCNTVVVSYADSR